MGIGNFLKMFDKLDDIIYKPVELLTDWAKEPLKTREHKRQQDAADNDLRREIELKTSNLEHEARIKADEKKLESELNIKKETEVIRILAEIEEMKKDKDFARMKAVSEAIIKYQQDLTKLNVEAINAIGNMQLELREKAQDLVYSKTLKYKELQDIALRDAMNDLQKIEREFQSNETYKNILIRAVDQRLANIIKTADNFLIELNNDIIMLNKGITLLTENGHRFIERHLEHLRAVGCSDDNLRRIESEKIIDAEIIK